MMISKISIAVFVSFAAISSTGNSPDAQTKSAGACTPDRPGARADVVTLLADPAASASGGLSHVDPNNLTILTEDAVCRDLRREFGSVYKVNGANAPYVATYYQVDDRFIVHIIPEEALNPETVFPSSPLIARVSWDKVQLLVFDQEFTQLKAFLM